MLLLHASVTLYVLVVVSVQPTSTATSDTKATVGVPQLSASPVTTVISGAGTAALHPARLIAAGLDAVGGVLSNVLVIVCVTLMLLLHASVTL